MKRTYIGKVFVIPETALMIDPTLRSFSSEIEVILQEFADGVWKNPDLKATCELAVAHGSSKTIIGDSCELSDKTLVVIAAETGTTKQNGKLVLTSLSINSRKTVISLSQIWSAGNRQAV